MSRKKAQIGKEKVHYIGFEITKRQRALGSDRKEAICTIAASTSETVARVSRDSWIVSAMVSNLGLIVKPLYTATKGPEAVLEWAPECRKVFDKIKKKFMDAPTVEIPDLQKPFQLYVYERQQMALGGLTQKLGSWKRLAGTFPNNRMK